MADGTKLSAVDPLVGNLAQTDTIYLVRALTSQRALVSQLAILAAQVSDSSAIGRSVLTAADAAAVRTALALVIGTNVQAFDAELAAIAGLTSAADKAPYFTGSGTAALADLTAAGRALIDDASAAAQRTTLSLGTLSTAGCGYEPALGNGGTVTQATSKATGVTLNKLAGTITMDAANLALATAVGFTFTNSTIAAADVVSVSIKSGATADAYHLQVDATAAGSCRISLRNLSLGALAEAVVINFVVLKGAAS